MIDREWLPLNRNIERVGYSGFISAVWMLWRMNRAARQVDCKVKFEVIVPMRWLA